MQRIIATRDEEHGKAVSTLRAEIENLHRDAVLAAENREAETERMKSQADAVMEALEAKWQGTQRLDFRFA